MSESRGVETVGQRTRNPLCLKQVKGEGWRGSIGKDEVGHAIFKSVVWGLRAAIKILAHYELDHGLASVLEKISKWAPKEDTQGSRPGKPQNDPEAYAAFVAGRVGVDPRDPFPLFHPDGTVVRGGAIEQVLASMNHYENGARTVRVDEIEDAITLWNGEVALEGRRPA